ncbi:MAG: DUF86 domain-containing protein [Methanotrichaceae archaeon]|nr:DUF86 domain-containing protein [Methanotrichaceae archaeon]
MRRQYIDYLQDMLENLEKVGRFVGEMSFEDFLQDEKTQYSVICALAVIGEAVKNLPPEVRQSHQEVPWKDIAGMRDRLIHGYFGVDTAILWKTATESVPETKSMIINVIDDEKLRSSDGRRK